jgi:Collagen triple helix repeat (20 copies)
MRRLRHPIRAIREPFGTAGLIVAMIALVAALGGTALAASKLNSTQKKEVEKIAKKYAGKPGATGPAGAAGATGPAGKEGAAGAAGKNGTAGTNGKSVVTGTPTSAECEEGGATVEVEGSGSKKHVCNGSPWTAGGTLPSGQTETGIWAPAHPNPAENEDVTIPISFTLPLAAPLEDEEENGTFGCQEPEATRTKKCQVHLILASGEEELQHAAVGTTAAQSVCPGSVADPKAEPGNLCAYANAFFVHVHAQFFNPPSKPFATGFGADTAGTRLEITSEAESPRILGGGTWAVTAE